MGGLEPTARQRLFLTQNDVRRVAHSPRGIRGQARTCRQIRPFTSGSQCPRVDGFLALHTPGQIRGVARRKTSRSCAHSGRYWRHTSFYRGSYDSQPQEPSIPVRAEHAFPPTQAVKSRQLSRFLLSRFQLSSDARPQGAVYSMASLRSACQLDRQAGSGRWKLCICSV